MSTDFNPGPGWRMLNTGEPDARGEMVVHYDDMGATTRWVREEPVPALPTEPYTVIRVTWKDTQRTGILTLVDGSEPMWLVAANITNYRNPTQVAMEIDDFEVLSEPRAVTAKAVLDRVRERIGRGAHAGFVDDITREFKVES